MFASKVWKRIQPPLQVLKKIQPLLGQKKNSSTLFWILYDAWPHNISDILSID